MSKIVFTTFIIGLMVSVSFIPLIEGITHEEITKEITVEIHTSNGIEVATGELSFEEKEKVSALLNNAKEKIDNLRTGEWSIQKKMDTKNIISDTLTELETLGIISKDIKANFNQNLFCLLFGYGTKVDRLTINTFAQMVFLIFLGDLLLYFPEKLVEKLGTLFEYFIEIGLNFSMLRSRILIPAVHCFIWGKMEVTSVGLLGYRNIVKKWSGRSPNPGHLTILGFTGLWVGIGEGGRASETWCIGSALYVV